MCEDIQEVIWKHFVQLVGTTAALSETALLELLEAQIVKISQEAFDRMETRITLEEMHSVVEAMLKNKILGQDGTPIEFFLAL